MLRTSTKAASPGLPDIMMAAGPIVTITYCSGLPIVSATIFESDVSKCCRWLSGSVIVVSSFKTGIS